MVKKSEKKELINFNGVVKPGYAIIEPIPMEKFEKQVSTLIIPDEIMQANKTKYYTEHPNQGIVHQANGIDWVETGDRVALGVAYVSMISNEKTRIHTEALVHNNVNYLIVPKNDIIFNYGAIN